MSYVLENQNEWNRLEHQSTLPQYDYRKELAGIPFQAGESVLDAGCGSGVVTRYLAETYPENQITGCDSAEERLIETIAASRHLKNAGFKAGALEKQDLFKENTFDAIICRYVLQHVTPDLRETVVANLFFWLKPGGKLILIDFDGTVHNLYPRTEFVDQTLKKIEREAKVDLRIGRKLPAFCFKAGFQNVTYRIETTAFNEESKQSELNEMQARLTHSMPFLKAELNSQSQAERFCQEFLSSLRNPESVYFYNKFVTLAHKARPILKIV